MKKIIVLLLVVLLTTLLIWRQFPIIVGDITKQTVYLSVLNCFHLKDNNAYPRMMLIDDDSGEGIFQIKEICDKLGCRATFAVVPAWLDSVKCDSLRKWQLEGFGIAIHGYNHGRWKDYSYEEVVDDIRKSLDFLKAKGFSIDKIQLVVTPGSNNTWVIRKAIYDMGFKMISGANIVNPDTIVFQLGRMFIKKSTDLEKVRHIMVKAKGEKGFVVLGTHSSIVDEFSPEKTEAILQMGIDMGYFFID